LNDGVGASCRRIPAAGGAAAVRERATKAIIVDLILHGMATPQAPKRNNQGTYRFMTGTGSDFCPEMSDGAA
jgi:hypothetical protein